MQTETSRRQAVVRALALAAGASAAIATPGAANATEADPLVSLAERYSELDKAENEAWDRVDELYSAARAEFPPWPKEITARLIRGNPDGTDRFWLRSELEILRFYEEYRDVFGEERMKVQRDQQLKARREYDAACDVVLARHGHPDAERLADKLSDERFAVLDQIMALQPRTLQGVLAKLRVANAFGGYRENADVDLGAKLVVKTIADLEQMVAGGAA